MGGATRWGTQASPSSVSSNHRATRFPRLLGSALWTWATCGLRLLGVLALAVWVWSAVVPARGTLTRGTAPSLSQAPSVSAGSGTATTWDEPRKASSDRDLLAQALPPPPSEFAGWLGARWRSVGPKNTAPRPHVPRWRSERCSVPAPRGPPAA
jgi:hypothetical protein